MKSKVFLFVICMASFAISLLSAQSADASEELKEYRKMYYTSYIDGSRPVYNAEDTMYLDFYPYQADFDLVAEYRPLEFLLDTVLFTYSGLERLYNVPGEIHFTIHGESFVLVALQMKQHATHPVYKNRLFLPFKDQSTGEITYGGGRYMEITISDLREFEQVRLNFNLAYNPLCAYADGFNCPIPPDENYLETVIAAGEKSFKKEK
jgi:uncharacterized protein (DUF1684 family)